MFQREVVSNMSGIILKAYDICSFRSSKPFSRGTEHFAESIFPPNPSTVYSALRTAIINEKNIGIDDFYENNFDNNILKEIGDRDKEGDLHIRGVSLYNKGPYLPIPSDVLSNSGVCKVIKLYSSDMVFSHSPFRYVPFIDDTSYKKVNGQFSVHDLNNYLCGNSNFSSVTEESDIISKDYRVGIGIDKFSSTVSEGLLYIAQAIEFNEGWCIYIIIEKADYLESKGLLRLGGGSRPFAYEINEKDYFSCIDKEKIMNIINRTRKFKVIFLSPAIMSSGWKSRDIDEENYMDINGIKIKLISALIGRPHKIGGFDMVKKQPKPMYNLIPAGSIYYFQIENEIKPETINSIFDRFHLKNFSDINKKQGFGLTVIGGYNEK